MTYLPAVLLMLLASLTRCIKLLNIPEDGLSSQHSISNLKFSNLDGSILLNRAILYQLILRRISQNLRKFLSWTKFARSTKKNGFIRFFCQYSTKGSYEVL
jgi:hypothetical protein